MFRVLGLSESGIWRLGDEHVAPFRKKPVLARANLTVSDVLAVPLYMKIDHDPPRHAAIVGWPSVGNELVLLAQHKSLAQQLAAAATLTMYPP